MIRNDKAARVPTRQIDWELSARLTITDYLLARWLATSASACDESSLALDQFLDDVRIRVVDRGQLLDGLMTAAERTEWKVQAEAVLQRMRSNAQAQLAEMLAAWPKAD